MKKFLIMLLFIVFMALPCMSALDPSIDNKKTWKNAYRFTGKPKDLFLDWCVEVEEAIDGTDGFSYVYYIPGTAPAATEGNLYYDASLDALVLRTASGWSTLEAGGDSSSLDEAYNGGAAITVDGGAVTLTAPNADDNTVIQIVQSDTGTALGIDINNAGTGNSIDIEGQSSANDIEGTGDLWAVSTAGIGTFVGLISGASDIVMENGEIINNATDDKILIDTSDEDLLIDFTTGANTITLGSNSTGGTTIDVGDFVTLLGLQNLTGEAGADYTIASANTGTFNLVLAQTGVGDNELRLTSAGTATNAIALTTATGGQTFTSATAIVGTAAAGAITLTATGGDASLLSADKSVVIGGEEAAVDAITLVSAAGGLDCDTALSISLKSTENTADSIELVSTAGGIDVTAAGAAGEDIDIVCTAGSVNITAGENHAGAMILKVDKGSSEQLQVLAIKGTGASAATESDASIQLESTVGGVGILSLLDGDNAIRLETNGGTNENIFIHSNQGTGADSITLLSDAGGIAATCSAGSIVATATGAASDITLTAGDMMILTSVDLKFFNGAAAETWEIEGTADAHEAQVVFTDPTADIVWTFPTGATDTLAIMGSTLATNVPEGVNSVTGASNAIIFEGTADAFETTLTVDDATADATITLPDDSGDILYAPAGTVDYAAGAGALPITHVNITYASQGAGEALTIPDGVPGQILQVNHDTDGGEGNITPDTATGYATVELDDDGDMVTFMWVDTVGWIIIGTAGVAAPPVVTL